MTEGLFADRVAVVTGSTQGVGAEVARMFAREGCAGVLICGRNSANGEAVAADIAALGAKAHFVSADLCDLAQVREIVPTALREFGRVDHLVNSAAITDRGNILDTSPDLYQQTLDLNLRAPFFLIQDAARAMIEQGSGGSIANVLSVNSYGGGLDLAPYSTSKGGLLTLTKNTANYLAQHRVRVNGIALGWTDTPNEDRIQRQYHGAGANWREQIEPGLPFGRMLKPYDVANTVRFLCSGESGIMTGAIVDLSFSVVGTGGTSLVESLNE